MAGLLCIRLVIDTSCAAFAHCISSPAASAFLGEKRIVVFNLGGGPCSASFALIDDGIVDVQAVSTISTGVSGADFDLRLFGWCVRELQNKHCKDASVAISLDDCAKAG